MAIRKKFLPVLLEVGPNDIGNDQRQLLAFRVKSEGLGVRNPMALAEDSYLISEESSKYLVATLLDGSRLNMSHHAYTVQEVVKAGKAAREVAEDRFAEAQLHETLGDER